MNFFKSAPIHQRRYVQVFIAFAVLMGCKTLLANYPITPKAFSSNRFEMEINGEPTFVYKFKDIHYAQFPHLVNSKIHIHLEIRRPFHSVEVGPRSVGIDPVVNVDSQEIDFKLELPQKVVVTLDGKERLFIFPEQEEDSHPRGINILDYGADPSGKTHSTSAIQEAIDKAPKGSLVRIPPGHYLSGTLFLRSETTLWLDAGALLQASGNPAEFEQKQAAFIVVENAENVKLAGRGTIDGSGAFLRHLTGNSGRLLAIRDSQYVTIEDLILRDPRSWNTQVLRSENVTLRNLKLLHDRYVSNTDGIDPDSSRHILIEKNFFYCGDDAVAIKSTNRNGRFEDVYDIVVRDNIILTKKSALKVGTESHASEMKDITFANNHVMECDRGMALYARDGTHMHSIRFIGNHFENNYPDYEQRLIHFRVQKRHGLSHISNILIQDCTANEYWPKPSLIRGLTNRNGISDVRIVRLKIAGSYRDSADGAQLELGPYSSDVRFRN